MAKAAGRSSRVSLGGLNILAEVQAATPGEQHRQWEELAATAPRREGA